VVNSLSFGVEKSEFNLVLLFVMRRVGDSLKIIQQVRAEQSLEARRDGLAAGLPGLHLHQSLRSPHPSSSRDHPREGDPPHRMEGGGKGGGSWHSEINFLCVSFYGTKGIKKNF